jgi:hypothetical protein
MKFAATVHSSGSDQRLHRFKSDACLRAPMNAESTF